MADSDPVALNLPAQTASPQRVSSLASRSTDRGGEGESNCPLWDGHIIDAIFPPV